MPQFLKRPWHVLGLVALLAIGYTIPLQMKAAKFDSYTASALTVPDDPALVTHDRLAVSYENHFANWTLIDGRGTSTVSVTTDDPWSVSTSESPHFEGYQHYIIENFKHDVNFSISDVNVSAQVAGGLLVPIVGPADSDHQRWSSTARDYRLAVRVVNLRTCRC